LTLPPNDWNNEPVVVDSGKSTSPAESIVKVPGDFRELLVTVLVVGKPKIGLPATNLAWSPMVMDPPGLSSFTVRFLAADNVELGKILTKFAPLFPVIETLPLSALTLPAIDSPPADMDTSPLKEEICKAELKVNVDPGP